MRPVHFGHILIALCLQFFQRTSSCDVLPKLTWETRQQVNFELADYEYLLVFMKGPSLGWMMSLFLVCNVPTLAHSLFRES